MQRLGYRDFQLADVIHPEDGKPYWLAAKQAGAMSILVCRMRAGSPCA